MADKVRVHTLAKELGVSSKVILDKCRAEEVYVKNHMSTLSVGLEATIREWFTEGAHETTVEHAAPVNLEKARKTGRRRSMKIKAGSTPASASDADTAVATLDGEEASSDTAVDEMTISEAAAGESPGSVAAGTAEVELPAVKADAAAVSGASPDDESAAVEETPIAGDQPSADSGAAAATMTEPLQETEGESGSEEEGAPSESVEDEKVVPAGPQNVPGPAKLKGPRVVRYEPVDESYRPPRPSVRGPRDRDPAGQTEEPARADARATKDRRPTAAEAARKSRTSRRFGGADRADEQLREWRDRDLAERQERISDATGRRIHRRRAIEAPGDRRSASSQKTEATVREPIVIKELAAATGVSMVAMLPLLKREFNITANLNTTLTQEMAEFIALEHGITLTVIPARTALDEIEEAFNQRTAKQPKSRPPVVTFLGHVDHGKTSLLDAIRKERVVADEDGGITQHIGAYHLDHKTAGRVTFLDTPGHEAFTAMRARGAKLTDIVVLVIAADDGVMPQTVEAINHAKAAKVPVVVALNKIDLGDQNVNKIYGQLSEHGLAPAAWGGEVDVMPTSASTGVGIAELIEHLAALGEVLDLKAGYKGDAVGTAIEAKTREGVGPVLTVLVQDGLLRKGDVAFCGSAYGKVRALVNDRGKQVKEAGPSIPVEVWGMDEVPLAGDKLYVVGSMQRAKTVAEEIRSRRVIAQRTQTLRTRSLEEAFKQREAGEVPELNVIIKADVDGSLEALRGVLGGLPDERVRLTIRHSAVGPVADSDVLLADASDAVIIAFRVLPGSGTRRLAEERGVDIRTYKVIYNAADDIKKALEGLLKPDESTETRASCEVRNVFRISKVGQVAGCMVVDGTIRRNHFVRLIRDGVVVRDGCKIASLKRFKDDAKEVRAGMECGIRIEGFDDVKSGDVIEAYEVVQLAQTL